MKRADKPVIGIDYGTRRIGIATAPVGGSVAFPHSVIFNDRQMTDRVLGIVEEIGAEAIVVGESKDNFGGDNILQAQIDVFVAKLKEKKSDLLIYLEPEQYSSFEAERYLGKGGHVDAAAAAIILQRWLDRQATSSS